MNQSNIISILIINDSPILGQALTMLLQSEPDITVVAQARHEAEALQLFGKHQPDVVLMDLLMPITKSVSSSVAVICGKFRNARIIVLKTFDRDEDICRGLRSGVKGYLLKAAEPRELFDAIRTVHKGQKYVPPLIAAKLTERMDNQELSDRELEVLCLIAKGKNNQQISTILNISQSTVRFHNNNIFGKLEVKDRTQALVTAVNRGIVWL
ncbi:MAG: response regulator transcription factor [Rivularia sp. (in: cyanobacteria)]